MKQIAQNYKSGELAVLDVPAPVCRPGGVLVRSLFSLISTGTEMMKVSEASLSMVGMARARPDQVKKVIDQVQQQGLVTTYKKVLNKLDSYTPLGYSLCGVVTEVGRGAEEFRVGQLVACAGNDQALHAEYNWVPVNLCAAVPPGVLPEHAAFATVASIAMHGVRRAEVQLGETAAVIGLGLIGQLVVRLLAAAGVQAIGIDPVPERCRLAEKAGRDPRWVIAPCAAVGRSSGQVEFNIAANLASSSVLPMMDRHLSAAPGSAYVGKQVVPMARLDELAPPLLAASGDLLLKVDTQGYEREVLAGATGLLGRVVAMQLELSLVPLYEQAPTFAEMVGYVADLGYELFNISPGFKQPKFGRLLQADGFFVRKGALQ